MALVLCATTAAACGGSAEPGGPPGSAGSPSGSTPAGSETGAQTRVADVINGTLLYSQTLAATHTVAFYEFPGARTAVNESLSMDSGQQLFFDGTKKFTTLSDMFLALNPSNEVPRAITEADARAAQHAYTEATQKLATASGEISPVTSEILAGATGTCSPDELQDGWGGSWFLMRTCTQGQFRYCVANKAWVDSGEFTLPWASWQQMEGDFNLRGHITGSHWGCTPPFPGFACGEQLYTDFDYDLLPRQLTGWNFTNANQEEVYGNSQCGHTHVAFLYNTH